MKKGLFWAIGDGDERVMLIYAVECDENGQRLIDTPVYNSKKGNSYSHQQSWADAAKDQPDRIKKKTWDYFPRGRAGDKRRQSDCVFQPYF